MREEGREREIHRRRKEDGVDVFVRSEETNIIWTDVWVHGHVLPVCMTMNELQKLERGVVDPSKNDLSVSIFLPSTLCGYFGLLHSKFSIEGLGTPP